MGSLHLLLAVLTIQGYVYAAPSDISKLEEIANIEVDAKPVEPNTLLEDAKNESNDTVQGQRQKRFFNYYGYGFPPMSPVIYPNGPSYDNRYEPPYTGSYGTEDPFVQIYRRLQQISQDARTPNFNLPPPPPFQNQFPIFFPVIYIPSFGCQCTPETPDENKPGPVKPPMEQNDTNVDLSNRFPEMEDERQNWGLVINETDTDDGLGEEFSRPISFVPIRPNRTMSRPAPEVEHGSSQGGANDQDGTTTTTTTTMRPEQGPPEPNLQAQSPPTSVSAETPTPCDGAVLTCCHQPQVTYDCFVLQGCPDPTSYGNPCDPQVILRVVNRFQRFYGQRSG